MEQNVVNSIDGATALKLDEGYEIKNSEEQNAVIDSFENNEESEILANVSAQNDLSNAIPNGVSIESASYIENSNFDKHEEIQINSNDQIEEEYTPKLFSEDHREEIEESTQLSEPENRGSDELFDQDVNEEEDFEIPAFLRKQKF